MKAAQRTRPPEPLRIVPMLEVEANQAGQYAAIRAAEAWNETSKRLDGIGHAPLGPNEIGLAIFYLQEDTTVHDLSALIHAVRPHLASEPTFRFGPHFRQEVTR